MSKTLKITIGIIVVLALLMIKPVSLMIKNSTVTPEEAAKEAQISKDQDERIVPVGNLDSIMKLEPRVKDFVLTDANVLYVVVLDDGTNRNGFAEYFCQHMKDSNISVERVKIVQYGTTNHPDRDNSYGILLGECWCN